MPVVLDAVTDAASGELISPEELVARLAGVRLLVVGESHTSMGFHEVQLRIIEGLHRSGRRVLVGLEMFPYTEQAQLDHWSPEDGFVSLARWYQNWGYHWNYYRDIFLFAREKRLPMFAVNTPREVISAVRSKGFQNLTPEEAAHIPSKVDTASEDHFELFKSYFDEAEGMHAQMTEAQWRAMFDAQCTWDATMAQNSVRALSEHGGEDAIMVVLIGSGHAAYGLGIQRQAAQWFEGKTATVIPIPVADEKKRPVESVRASYADFVWGLPPEQDPLYPELGIATTEEGGSARRRILSVDKDSPAALAGMEVGDVLVSMDGKSIPDRETLNRLMAEKRWGDEAAFLVDRAGRQASLRVLFRRRYP